MWEDCDKLHPVWTHPTYCPPSSPAAHTTPHGHIHTVHACTACMPNALEATCVKCLNLRTKNSCFAIRHYDWFVVCVVFVSVLGGGGLRGWSGLGRAHLMKPQLHTVTVYVYECITHGHTHIHNREGTHSYLCMCVCVSPSVCVCMSICACVCLCVHVVIHARQLCLFNIHTCWKLHACHEATVVVCASSNVSLSFCYILLTETHIDHAIKKLYGV
jgi:hypothetical protein